jgi:hypothetical protein
MSYGLEGAVVGQNAISARDYADKAAIVSEMQNRTIGQNIAAQIAHHKAEIARLEGIAGQLRNGASMLDLRIEDLRRVMQY